MSEKSGIQMIEEIKEEVSILNKRFTIVEQMMKELLNRSNMGHLNKQIIHTSSPNSASISASSPLPNMEIKPEPKIGDVPLTTNIVTNTTKVLGKIKNKEGKVISGVNIKIYDSNNNPVKETRTNKAGEWVSFLPSGKYIAEYKLKDIINANVTFNIEDGQTFLRVAQPSI